MGIIRILMLLGVSLGGGAKTRTLRLILLLIGSSSLDILAFRLWSNSVLRNRLIMLRKR
jgi:hypothetical protein